MAEITIRIKDNDDGSVGMVVDPEAKNLVSLAKETDLGSYMYAITALASIKTMLDNRAKIIAKKSGNIIMP